MNTDDPNHIIELIAASETLANAWQTMLVSNTDGLDPATVQTANADLDATLTRASSLIHAPASGSGEPTPTRLERRLIACAITHTIGSHLAQETSPAAFPSSGSTTALSEYITDMRADGRVRVYRCCLAPTTVHRIIQSASEALPSLLGGPVTTLLSAIAHTRHEPQLVDALRDAALAPIDNAMADAGHGYARCGQWIIICEPDDARLDTAVALLVATMAARGLLLDGSRTQTTSFDEEFCPLGTDYTATTPVPRTTSATPEASAEYLAGLIAARGRQTVPESSGAARQDLEAPPDPGSPPDGGGGRPDGSSPQPAEPRPPSSAWSPAEALGVLAAQVVAERFSLSAELPGRVGEKRRVGRTFSRSRNDIDADLGRLRVTLATCVPRRRRLIALLAPNSVMPHRWRA